MNTPILRPNVPWHSRFTELCGLPTLLVAIALLTGSTSLHAQRVEDPSLDQSSVGTADPSEVFLKAFTSVQQGEKLEEDGKLRPALSKYRFAASLLEQLNQTNPNWQPLIVRYRVRKTTENIRKLEDKLQVQAPVDAGAASPTRPNSAGASNADDDLPIADNPTDPDGRPLPTAPMAAPVDALNRTTMELGAKLARSQQDLKAAQTALVAAKKDELDAIKKKDDVEFQLHSFQSSANILSHRLDRIASDRKDLQKELDQVQAHLAESLNKNPGAADTRKELRAKVVELTKSLAKATADAADAQKDRDQINVKLTDAENRNTKVAAERDAALAQADSTKDAAAKIQSLQSENEALNQKLAVDESSITQLTAEAVKKKEELEGMQKELTSVKDQLTTTRDQQDRSETTITELRQKLDDDAKQMTDLKSKGMTSEDLARMTNENNLLKGIVMKQLKVDASRALARKLVSDELARLEIQSNVLNEQIEQLGRPTVQLTDEERTLFHDPQVTLSDAADPAAFAATITAVKPGSPSDQPPVTVTPSQTVAPDVAPVDSAANLVPLSGATSIPSDGPKVETSLKPKVSDDLQPLALQAKENFDRGHYNEAEEAYKKLLARDPKNPYLLSNQGVVLFRQNKLKSAEVDLKKAVTFDPRDAFSLATLGIVYYRMHRYDDAITNLTQAIQLDPKNATAHNYLGITSSQKGWPEAALEEVQKAIALNPKYADAHFNIAVIYATNRPPAKEQAEEHYKTAVSLGASPDPALEKLIGKN